MRYILRIAREAFNEKTLTIDDFIKNLRDVEEINFIGSHVGARGIVASIDYEGSREQLYEILGYTPEQVHIEERIEHKKYGPW